MGQDFIDLESVRISYSRKDGSFRITSADSRLRGKPFMLTLSRQSRAMDILRELFAEEGIISNDDALPDSSSYELDRFEDAKDEHDLLGNPKPLQDSRLIFPVGERGGDGPISIDLGYAAHTLITGDSGSGKTELLVALAQVASSRKLSVRTIDPQRDGIARRVPGPSRYSQARGVEQSETLLRKVAEEVRGRIRALDGSGSLDSIAYESKFGAMAPLLVFVDSVDTLGDGSAISQILSEGQRAGIYLFATAQSVFGLPELADELLLLNFSRRIALGRPLDAAEDSISPRLLQGRGRGTLSVHGSAPAALQFLRGSRVS